MRTYGFTNDMFRWKQVRYTIYARLLFKSDVDSDVSSGSIFDMSDTPYFEDVIANFAIVFGLRFRLFFLVLGWANYKPLYL